MAMEYRCAHCGRELGPVVEGEPEPVCPDHPECVVEVFDNADPES